MSKTILIGTLIWSLYQMPLFAQSVLANQSHQHELVKICKLWGKIKYVYSKPDEFDKCDSVLVQFLRIRTPSISDSYLSETQFRRFAEQYFPKLRDIENRDTIIQIPLYIEQKRQIPLSLENSLLSLFDIWNTVQYHFAYAHLMDKNWEQVLEDFIPRFENLTDSFTYLETVIELSTYLNDSHARVYSPILDAQYHFVPPIEVNFVQNQTVVTSIDDSMSINTAVNLGDVIDFVDGKSITEHRNQWRKRISTSTEQYFTWRFHRYLLAGDSSPVSLGITRKDSFYTVQVPRSRLLAPTLIPFAPHQQYIHKLPPYLAYIDGTRLPIKDVDSIFSNINAKGLLLDIRGYPQGTFDRIFAWLTSQPKTIAQSLWHPKFYHNKTGTITATTEKQTLYPGQKHELFKGKIVVLVNASAISQSEHTCLALLQSRRRKDIRFVGEATAGADGEVQYVTLADNVRIRFTKIDIRHADGRQLQRIGILPDVEAHPTIAGIRAGRDEVLEKGVEVLRELLRKEKK